MEFRLFPLAEAAGATLAHRVMAGERVFKKGAVLSADDITLLASLGVAGVMAAKGGAGDVGEDAAAERLARLLAGEGLLMLAPSAGRVYLRARHGGLVLLQPEVIDAVNGIDEAVTCATVAPWARVRAGQLIASIKIIPFFVREASLERIEKLVKTPPLWVAKFTPKRVVLIQTLLPGTKESLIRKTGDITRARIEKLQGGLVGQETCAHNLDALVAEITRTCAAKPDILIISGASAISDRCDIVPLALKAAGGEVTYLGMPVDPGNLLLLGYLGEIAVIGMPGCARSPKRNGFDWVLERLAAGVRPGPHDIQHMGVGGLLLDGAEEGEEGLETRRGIPQVAAILLAAGMSSRFGAENKLLAKIQGKTVVANAVDQLAGSAARDHIYVVTGHDKAGVEAALQGAGVTFVHNPDYAGGLSTSLKTGLEALPGEVDAAVICLADMPRVTSAVIDQLIAAYEPGARRLIVVPTHHGIRGNPVLWDRRFFKDMLDLSGDSGARHLLDVYAGLVVEVDVGADGVLGDIDRPGDIDLVSPP
jgi:molybdenum cofactor cytidylyltransferase